MAETKHTPGPWEIEYSRTGVEWPTIIAPREPRYADGSAYIICEIDESYPIGKKTPQKELALANATLIAAAPTLQAKIGQLEAEKAELVDALRVFVDAFGPIERKHWSKAFVKAGTDPKETYPSPASVAIQAEIAEQAIAAIAKAEPK